MKRARNYLLQGEGIEAIRNDGSEGCAQSVLAWADPLTHGRTFAVPEKGTHRWTVVVETLEGAFAALPGDYVVKGAGGSLHLCKQDLFEGVFVISEGGAA